MSTHPGVQIDVLEGTAFEVYPKMLSARRLTPDQPLVHFGYMNAQHDGTAAASRRTRPR